ncbi:MAG TPA: flagellar basal body L-ring protein FlgH [Acidobacteriaceae bacterium]|jgi:flagellar L-ring protein precursor FlgH|nr:flagellar basal body L-ring protein FlgH [Acidobacteriaceae bacterium]
MKHYAAPWVALLALMLCIAPAEAKKKLPTRDSSPPDAALNAYIARVRAESAAEARTPGSIWIDDGQLTRLNTDVKATHENDPISVVVVESLSASTDGTVKNSRSSNANSQVSALLGKISAGNALNSLLNQASSDGLNAQGQSVTDSSLTTTLGGEVEAVLPNGMLVIQAVRQVSFNQQTELIRLRGLVRPADINARNQVLSTDIANLELEVVGKGIINDYTHRPNAVVRFIEKWLVF